TGWVQLSGYGEVPSWRLDVWNASATVAPDDVL
ncbi:histidine phosphatase family protein, partial [Rhodococcus opacus]|nr:histidine phosphatase family protein [Rhodococcus opacus]